MSDTLKPNLVIQTAFVGDLLLCLPLLKTLRSLEPSRPLYLLCRNGLGEFFRQTGILDEVIEVNKADRQAWRVQTDRMKKIHWHWVVCPHQSTRSALLVWRLKADRKIGFKKLLTDLVFTEKISRPMGFPDALRQLALLQNHSEPIAELLATGFEAAAAVPAWANMRVPKLVDLRQAWRLKKSFTQASLKSQNILANWGSQRIAFLAPGSVWKTKMWRSEGYIELARHLTKTGYQVVLMGAANEKVICEQIRSEVPACHILTGETSLFESAELMATADILFCNDSGAMHLAATMDVPTVAVFGPTTLALGYRPWQNQAEVAEINLPCRPCGRHGSETCPLGTHDCMKKVSVELVLMKMQALQNKTL